MINKMIEASLKNRGLVVISLLVILGFGIRQYRRMPVDAFPDISPVMVPVFAEAHGMAPEEVERLITYPIESAMNGLPGVTQIKSTSAFGMAVVYVYFKDSVDIYFARQLVGERLNAAMSELPEMHEPPTLGPISTGLGQIFIYYLTCDDSVDLEGKDKNSYLRELNDWVVKFQLQTVPGVTDILSVGGHVLQYQVRVDPYALHRYDLSLEDIVTAIEENNRNAGGQFLLLGSEEHLVRGIGLLETLDDLRGIPVKVFDGVAVRIGDVAEVAYGNEIRRGVVTRNGEQEVVSGLVLKLYGENTSDVIDRLLDKVADVQRGLPKGVSLVPYYEQAELVREATGTVKRALIQGSILVTLTLLLFLGNFRTAFIVALSLPLCALAAVMGMAWTGISANLMSLGGIAIGIGMLGDGAIVMVENIFRHLGRFEKGEINKEAVVLDGAGEVSRPILFSISIIIIVFLPIFTLEGVEGKMFAPMAFTISFALFGSMIVALFAAPALSVYLLKQGTHREFFLLRLLKNLYRPLLEATVRRRALVLLMAVVLVVLSILGLGAVGTEFIPTLEEGSILIGVAMAPSISLEAGTETILNLEKRIMEFPQVDEVISRIGRPEAGSHPHPVNYAEVHIELNPEDEWPEYGNKRELIAALDKALSSYPGVQLNFTQPIQNAFDELLSGIKAQLAIKVFGEDLDAIRKTAEEIHHAVEDVPGLTDLSVEQSFGQPQVQIVVDRAACSREGVNVSEILELTDLAVGGEVVGNIYRNNRRFGIHVRYQEPYRADPEAIRNLLVHTDDEALIPLFRVADVKEITGPIQINREKNQRRWTVQGNIRGRDLGGVVEDVRKRVENRIDPPPGVFIEYGGQFENQERAMNRLMIIVPVVLATVFLLLWMTFGLVRHAWIIFIGVPLALIGGVAGLILTGEYLSVPASVGFIALFGIAVQNGVVLVSCLNQLRRRGRSLEQAIVEGGLLRLRPVLMTALTTVVGLLPLLLSTGIGSEVQRPLATVVVFGLSSSTLLTLFVIPAAYAWIERGRELPPRQD